MTNRELVNRILTALGLNGDGEAKPDAESKPEEEPWVPAPSRPEYQAYMKRVTAEREAGTLSAIPVNK
jgi:hypothetical protein